MKIDLVWEDESEKEVVRLLNLDWLLYGQLHVTNAHGVTRLDPTRVTYRLPSEEEVAVVEDGIAAPRLQAAIEGLNLRVFSELGELGDRDASLRLTREYARLTTPDSTGAREP